mgnify:CR=1 FL=1
MIAAVEKIAELITAELDMLWLTHRAAGLEGHMCLYTRDDQVPFRAKQPGIRFWFGSGESRAAAEEVLKYLN